MKKIEARTMLAVIEKNLQESQVREYERLSMVIELNSKFAEVSEKLKTIKKNSEEVMLRETTTEAQREAKSQEIEKLDEERKDLQGQSTKIQEELNSLKEEFKKNVQSKLAALNILGKDFEGNDNEEIDTKKFISVVMERLMEIKETSFGFVDAFLTKKINSLNEELRKLSKDNAQLTRSVEQLETSIDKERKLIDKEIKARDAKIEALQKEVLSLNISLRESNDKSTQSLEVSEKIKQQFVTFSKESNADKARLKKEKETISLQLDALRQQFSQASSSQAPVSAPIMVPSYSEFLSMSRGGMMQSLSSSGMRSAVAKLAAVRSAAVTPEEVTPEEVMPEAISEVNPVVAFRLS